MQLHVGKHPQDQVLIFKQQENLLHFKDMFHNLFYFPQNAVYFILIYNSVQTTLPFFYNHAIKFKYTPQLTKG